MNELNLAALSSEPGHRIRWGRLFVILLALLILVPILAWLGRQAVLRYQAQEGLDAVVAEITAKDPGWRIDELEAARQPVPNEKNGALLVMEVKEMLPKPWRPGPPVPKPQRLIDAKRYADLRTAVQSLETATAKALPLAEFPTGRFPNGEVTDPLAASKHCTDAADVALLLRMKAMVLAQEKDPDGALRAALAIAGAARSVGDEPRLVAQQARLRCRNELMATMERVLAQGQPSEAVLANLQRALEEEEFIPCALYAALGERAGCHQTALAAENGSLDTSEIFLHVRPPVGWVEKGEDYCVNPLVGTRLRKAHAEVLQLLTQLVETARLEPEEQEQPSQKLAASFRQFGDDYQLFPDLDKRVIGMPQTVRRNRTLLRIGIVALAVERYRLANNHWPDKLDALVPAQLTKLPIDPYTRAALRLERREDGVTISSPGKEVKEGTAAEKRRRGVDPARLAVELWDVAKRRQQAVDNDGEEGDMFDRRR
jgi:hypothetical protein